MLAGVQVLDCSDKLGWLAGRALADLGADVIKLEAPGAQISGGDWQAYNANKRLLRLDLDSPQGRLAFDRVLSEIDIVIETAQPGHSLASHFDPDRLRAINGRLIHVSVTPFGRSGPRASWLASDIELMAAGGAMSLAGEPDGKPMRITVPQAACWAGAHAAIGALTALVRRTAGGGGQHVDVSAAASVVVALSHAPAFWDIEEILPTRCGAFVTGRSVKGARFRAFWPCADGYVNFVLYGGHAGRRTNEQLIAWMRERGEDLGALASCDWNVFNPPLATQEQIDELERPIGKFLRQLTKREFLKEASRREILGYPVATVEDISADPQLEARGFWQDLTGPDSQTRRHCGSFYILDGSRPRLRHAPGSEVDLDTLLRGFSPVGEELVRYRPTPPQQRAKASAPAQALAGVKVIEFGGYAAGPHVGKMLAAFGATVVHVESRQRPDGFRLEYPPFKDGKPGLNRGGCFAFFNDSKYGITLDLKKPSGLELGRRLLAWCDIAVENMRPGVMDRLGLGYSQASRANPRLVMLSTCNMGQTGPRAHTPGFGSQLSAMAGFCGLTGEPDGLPMLLYGPYIDYVASTLGAAAVLAALNRQRRTGRGAWIDLSQYETGLMFIAGALLDYHASGLVANRNGNHCPEAAPHEAYRCAEGGWIALSCWSDEEFERLAIAIERPALAKDPRFRDRASRILHAADLDAAMAGWASGRTAPEGAQTLQQARVHAHAVNTIADLFRDPQLIYRRVWRRRRHPVIGEHAYFFSAFDLSESPGDIVSPAPLLGADNETVFKGFIGLTEEEYNAQRALGSFD